MFTGIITSIGSIRSVVPAGSSARIDVACEYVGLALGESIAVDGVCLTVETCGAGHFTATMSAETLSRTTLGSRTAGARVSLERALAVGDRMGGHIVAGHVDGVGCVREIEPVADAQRWRFEAPREVHRFISEKGSIAVDGVSLTVNAVGPTTFDVMLVPFTLAATALADKRVGDKVNLEADVIARYVARMLDAGREASGVTVGLLERAGFVVP